MPGDLPGESLRDRDARVRLAQACSIVRTVDYGSLGKSLGAKLFIALREGRKWGVHESIAYRLTHGAWAQFEDYGFDSATGEKPLAQMPRAVSIFMELGDMGGRDSTGRPAELHAGGD